MLVEPFAADEVADNLNPVGRLYYGASSLMWCRFHWPAMVQRLVPRRESDGCAKIMVDQGGFSTMRRATETPFNIVLEARP